MSRLVLGTVVWWSPGFFKPHSSCFIHDVSIRWVSGTGGVEISDLIHGCPTALEMVPDPAWGYHSSVASKPWILMYAEVTILLLHRRWKFGGFSHKELPNRPQWHGWRRLLLTLRHLSHIYPFAIFTILLNPYWATLSSVCHRIIKLAITVVNMTMVSYGISQLISDDFADHTIHHLSIFPLICFLTLTTIRLLFTTCRCLTINSEACPYPQHYEVSGLISKPETT
jgi:hypothetical protein